LDQTKFKLPCSKIQYSIFDIHYLSPSISISISDLS
jgi:hypothetical protein